MKHDHPPERNLAMCLRGLKLPSFVASYEEFARQAERDGWTHLYSVALGGIVWKPLLRLPIVKLASFFLLVNVSIFQAWVRYWSGERLVTWEPSKR